MIRIWRACGFWLASLVLAISASAGPIALHPENPRYFLFRGKPTFLITSGEHYGAVLNLDFDEAPYLDELHARGFNLTRVFSGTYREVPGSFRIRENTLAPAPGRYIAPWARGGTPGAADGGHKFDLDTWDAAYFRRLKHFCAEAGKRGIVVEYVLFCTFYVDELWDVNPMNARNNTSGVGAVPRTEVYTLKHRDLVAKQEAFVREVVAELKDVDNLYYEICNEPYFGGVGLEWQERIAATIADAEKGFPARHLIAQNIANGSARVERPNPAVSILNFHYATPPEVVSANSDLKRVIADDETGFRGTEDAPYRMEAWEFLPAGGGVFDNLDYSFTTAREDGSAQVVEPTPGGGGPDLRAQLKILKDFLEGFDFEKMSPDSRWIKETEPPGHANRVRVLSEPGRAYAAYLRAGPRVRLVVDLPAGSYRVEWVNPRTGAVDTGEDLDHRGGRAVLRSPTDVGDAALRIKARGG